LEETKFDLSVIGDRRKVNLIKRNALAVDECFAFHAKESGPDLPVNFARAGPIIWMIVPHIAPLVVASERAKNARRF
jgi:hypothetical protein